MTLGMREIDKRIAEYDLGLIPNTHLRKMLRTGTAGMSMGFPSLSLLYFSALCSLPRDGSAVVVETGTNMGSGTIALAQAVKDAGGGIVHTIEISSSYGQAKENIKQAGLDSYTNLIHGDSLTELLVLAAENKIIHFAFLDGAHDCESIVAEFVTLRPAILASNGKIFFDNTSYVGVLSALEYIKKTYGGNFVEFLNCSHRPPGNTIWQG